MESGDVHSVLQQIMKQFATDTGLTGSGKKSERYLWTDAFAVCNFLELYNHTGDRKFLDLTIQLVDQVHNVLGRHRSDDNRRGWISGLNEVEGKKHPTMGGLRIGKSLNERQSGEPYDSGREWDRDGQYYHYLTKWMHALNRLGRITNEKKYNIWAIELAKVAHVRFTYVPAEGGYKRMYWKMSIDLSYPQVFSMGHHDPLDGLISYLELQSTADLMADESDPGLHEEINDLHDICKGKDWATEDPLGLGGLLFNAFRLVQVIGMRNSPFKNLLYKILEDVQMGLAYYAKTNHLNLSADYRLAFRELGLAIGLKGLKSLEDIFERNRKSFPHPERYELILQSLAEYFYLACRIEEFWMEKENQDAPSWMEHMNINRVMLGTCLAPDGFLNV